MKRTLSTFILIAAAACAYAAGTGDFDGRPGPGARFPAAPAPMPSAAAVASTPGASYLPETVPPGIFNFEDLPVRSRRPPLTPEEREAEFRFITGKMETVYSHLENKQKIYGFSYEALKADYLPRLRACASPSEYQAELKAFITVFHDPHLGAYFYSDPTRPQDTRTPPVTNTLTEDGILITRIARLYTNPGQEELITGPLEESLKLAAKARALIVDVRGNPGGNDGYTSEYLSRLVSKPFPAGMVTIKISSETLARYGELEEDPERPGWTPWRKSSIRPKGDSPFSGPVALLIDGGCVSSCEGTAMRFKFSGIAKLYGETTMGSSGYPITIPLPYSNGAVRIPTWIQLQPDGTPIEDHGIEPHIRTEPREALDLALADIRKFLAEPR